MPRPSKPLPEYLQGTITKGYYNVWLREKTGEILEKDRKRNRPCANGATFTLYENTIHEAVCNGGEKDPFTGEPLQWELIEEWDAKKAKDNRAYVKRFLLMPTLDHCDPAGETVDFEICSWKINSCKNCQTPAEFIAMCRKIIAHRKCGEFGTSVIPVYELPAFLEGICTLKEYRKWILRKAKYILERDQRRGRICSIGATMSIYRRAIHAAVIACGLFDPFTGDRLAWEKIGTWVSEKQGGFTVEYNDFALLPTIDHTDPEAKELQFEICGWLINTCKSNFTPEEFVAICKSVVNREPQITFLH